MVARVRITSVYALVGGQSEVGIRLLMARLDARSTSTIHKRSISPNPLKHLYQTSVGYCCPHYSTGRKSGLQSLDQTALELRLRSYPSSKLDYASSISTIRGLNTISPGS